MVQDRSSSDKRNERRALRDRRRKPTNPFSLRAYRGRRQAVRREADRRHAPYTDRYSRCLLLAALLLILLCVADALYTILHVTDGGIELNPLMQRLLQRSVSLFFVVKFALTGLGVVLLVIYRHHPLGRFVFGGTLIVYGILFFYQILIYCMRLYGGG